MVVDFLGIRERVFYNKGKETEKQQSYLFLYEHLVAKRVLMLFNYQYTSAPDIQYLSH